MSFEPIDDQQAEVRALRDEIERLTRIVSDALDEQEQEGMDWLQKLHNLQVKNLQLQGLLEDVLDHVDAGGKDLRDTKFWAMWIKRVIDALKVTEQLD